MARFILTLALVSTMLALSPPAQAAGLTRTYVSQAGSDSNPCNSTQPCRHFANAYAATAANGIITALDPGGYGPIAITTAVTINGLGWASITAPSGGDGIDINAGASDQVTLIGLTVDGAGAGGNGVVLNSGGSLTITNCVVQNFVGAGTTGNGVLIQPTSGTVKFLITNTTATNNAFIGLGYAPPSGSPSADGVIDHVVTTGNGAGIIADARGTSGGATVLTVSNSTMSANSAHGIAVGNGAGTFKVSIDNVSVSDNGVSGIDASTGTNVLLGRSVVTANAIGINNGTSPSTFYTLKSNLINLNTTDFTGTALNTSLNVQ
jgi:hypothetical protein